MNRLIVLPLLIIMTCAILTQTIKLNAIGFNQTNSYSVGTQNGESGKSVYFIGKGFIPASDPNNATTTIDSISLIGVDGLLALMIGFIAIATLLGVHFFGSGLSDSSINIIYKSTVFYTIWGIFSFLGLGVGNEYGIISIPVFGVIIYFILTLVYVVGVQSQINTHE
jgi:hypothetical protein